MVEFVYEKTFRDRGFWHVIKQN